jgi:hypothetical protein
MTIITQHTDADLINASVNRAVSELPLNELIALKNELRPDWHTFVTKSGDIKECHINEIRHWAINNVQTTIEGDKFRYYVNGVQSPATFADDDKAITHAFDTYLVPTL